MNAPTATIPETEGRRAAMTREIASRTGLDEAVIGQVMRAFYAAARRDRLLGPVFARVPDWDSHMATIGEFWSSVALMTGRYHGRPMEAHQRLGLTPAHFARWLALFEHTVRQFCTPEGAGHLMDRAHRIARTLEAGCTAAPAPSPAPSQEARPDAPGQESQT